jgi:hypothetical protein
VIFRGVKQEKRKRKQEKRKTKDAKIKETRLGRCRPRRIKNEKLRIKN